MKKTLITLLALSGIAMGAATTGSAVNTALKTAITDTPYSVGSEFCLTLNITVNNNLGSNTGFIKFAESGWIVDQQRKYWGINTADSNLITEVTGKYTKTYDDGAYTYTASSISPLWAQAMTEDAEGNVTVSSVDTRDGLWTKTIGVEIATDGTDSWVTLSYDTTTDIPEGTTDTWKFTGVVLDANDIKLDDGLDVNSYTINIPVTPVVPPSPGDAVPEPTTATLSLLALAGLAARRRRR